MSIRDAVSPTVRRLSVETGVDVWGARMALVARGWDYERALRLVLASLALGRSVADMVGAERDIERALAARGNLALGKETTMLCPLFGLSYSAIAELYCVKEPEWSIVAEAGEVRVTLKGMGGLGTPAYYGVRSVVVVTEDGFEHLLRQIAAAARRCHWALGLSALTTAASFTPIQLADGSKKPIARDELVERSKAEALAELRKSTGEVSAEAGSH